jgi:Restriction endonuclease
MRHHHYLLMRMKLLGRFRRRRASMTSRVRHLHHLLILTPAAFELAVADLFRDLGFKKVRRVGRAGELAADIVAKDEKGRSVIIQCKRYDPAGKVGSREIQLFIGMARTHHRADRAIFVTTAEFSRPAIDLARRHRIELIDGNRLAATLVEARGDPEPGAELTLYDLLTLQTKGVVDAVRAMSILRENADRRLLEAKGSGCQCVSNDVRWAASLDEWQKRGALVL